MGQLLVVVLCSCFVKLVSCINDKCMWSYNEQVNDLPKILCIHSDKQIYQTYQIVWISSESHEFL